MNRVVSIDVRTVERNIPRFVPLENDKYYTCISSSFLADGGDGFEMIAKHNLNHL